VLDGVLVGVSVGVGVLVRVAVGVSVLVPVGVGVLVSVLVDVGVGVPVDVTGMKHHSMWLRSWYVLLLVLRGACRFVSAVTPPPGSPL
jgi:hypothetical protein